MKIGAAVNAAVTAPLRDRSLRPALSLLALIVSAVVIFSVIPRHHGGGGAPVQLGDEHLLDDRHHDRAGADFVLSYASTGATEAWNLLREDSTLLLAEGLVVFRVPMPPTLAGRRLGNTSIPTDTGCTVVAVVHNGHAKTTVDGDTLLPPSGDLVLIGDDRAETRFLQRYVATNGASWWSRVTAPLRR